MANTVFNAQAAAMAMARPLLDFVYPPFCFLCDSKLVRGESKICEGCWGSFKKIVRGDEADTDLKNKFRDHGIIDDCFSLYLFEKEGKIQKALHLLKYEGKSSIGIRLGLEIGKELHHTPEFYLSHVLLPIPLHNIKLRERTFNQSEYICRGISLILGIPNQPAILKRAKYTETQTKLGILERKENMSGAFIIPEKRRASLVGKTVTLVDDVITTGATLLSCARELKEIGVQKVLVVSVAHAF